jgi:hypothetical protein
MGGERSFTQSVYSYTDFWVYKQTRTKTSIRYAKENDREKRERKVEEEI